MKPGRPSAASLEVAQVSSVSVIDRPDAPYDLTDAQTEEWWAVVNRLPANWFPRETHGMLADYCRHVCRSRRVAQMIATAENDENLNLIQLDRLYKMGERESRAISSLAGRMRISQQATISKRADKPPMIKRPWES